MCPLRFLLIAICSVIAATGAYFTLREVHESRLSAPNFMGVSVRQLLNGSFLSRKTIMSYGGIATIVGLVWFHVYLLGLQSIVIGMVQ